MKLHYLIWIASDLEAEMVWRDYSTLPMGVVGIAFFSFSSLMIVLAEVVRVEEVGSLEVNSLRKVSFVREGGASASRHRGWCRQGEF